MRRALRITLAGILALAACLAAAEVGRRVLDGYRLTTVRLVKDPNNLDLTYPAPREQSLDAMLAAIPVDIEANAAWFYQRPEDVSPRSPAWVNERRVLGHDAGANYVWNTASLNLGTEIAYFESIKSSLDDVFTFRTPANDPRPRYRFYPEIDPGWGFTNRFGWKSRAITLAKPPGVVRIAMLGDSTTGTYPKLVEHWLNLWATDSRLGVRFEIIDASRPASDALDAAAIFGAEVRPFDPDYVVVYGFGNGIANARDLVPVPPDVLARTRPAGRLERWARAASTALDPLTPWTAAAVFLQHRLVAERGDSLASEPAKPATQMSFPRGISEDTPDPAVIAGRDSAQLMGLNQYLKALNRIDALAKEGRTRLFVSTFRVLAVEGLLLPKGGAFYRALNEGGWWPFTYAEIQRALSFFNRTVQAWAVRTGNRIIPINEQMPWRQEVYVDGMHERPAGEALHAWIVTQQLMPVIRDDVRQHRLPHQWAGAAAYYSDQYWKIERTRTVDAITIGKAMNAAVAPPPAVEIAGAFLLSQITSADTAADVVAGAAPRITTSTQPLGYAAFVPLDPAVGGAASGRGQIEVRIRVTRGRLSVGVLNKSAQKFLKASKATQSAGVQTIVLDIEDLREVGSVMISNDRGTEEARSSGELHGIVLKRVRE